MVLVSQIRGFDGTHPEMIGYGVKYHHKNLMLLSQIEQPVDLTAPLMVEH